MHIPMLDLKREYEYLKPNIDQAIARALSHQHWILGPEVQELEEKIAAYIGVPHAIGVASGTDALLLALRALALQRKGKEFFEKETVKVVLNNPRQVQTAAVAAIKSSFNRREATGLMLSPGTLTS